MKKHYIETAVYKDANRMHNVGYLIQQVYNEFNIMSNPSKENTIIEYDKLTEYGELFFSVFRNLENYLNTLIFGNIYNKEEVIKEVKFFIYGNELKVDENVLMIPFLTSLHISMPMTGNHLESTVGKLEKIQLYLDKNYKSNSNIFYHNSLVTRMAVFVGIRLSSEDSDELKELMFIDKLRDTRRNYTNMLLENMYENRGLVDNIEKEHVANEEVSC